MMGIDDARDDHVLAEVMRGVGSGWGFVCVYAKRADDAILDPDPRIMQFAPGVIHRREGVNVLE
jgi:hypothetical protein